MLALDFLLIALSDHLTLDVIYWSWQYLYVWPASMIPQESQEDEKLPALNLLICLVARYLHSLYWSGHITFYISGLSAQLDVLNPTQTE